MGVRSLLVLYFIKMIHPQSPVHHQPVAFFAKIFFFSKEYGRGKDVTPLVCLFFGLSTPMH